MTALLRLYPRDWRERYGEEFLALLEERPPDALDHVDIVRGAIDARVHPQQRPASAAPDPAKGRVSDRWLGVATTLGAVILVAGLVVALNGPMVIDDGGTYRDGGAAIPFLIVAFVLLAVGMLRASLLLPSRAEGGRAGAVLAAFFGVWWSAMIWMLGLWIVASIGIVALAVAARRSGVWGRLDTSLVLGGLAVAWSLGSAGMLGLLGTNHDAYVVFFLALLPIWVGVGHAVATGRAPVPHPAAAPPFDRPDPV